MADRELLKMNVTFENGKVHWVSVPFWWNTGEPMKGKEVGGLLVVDEDGKLGEKGVQEPEYQLASSMILSKFQDGDEKKPELADRLAERGMTHGMTSKELYERAKAFAEKVKGACEDKVTCKTTPHMVEECQCDGLRFGLNKKADKDGPVMDLYVQVPVSEMGRESFAKAMQLSQKAIDLVKTERPRCDTVEDKGALCAYGAVTLTLMDQDGDGKDDYVNVVMILNPEIGSAVYFYNYPFSIIEDARKYNREHIK